MFDVKIKIFAKKDYIARSMMDINKKINVPSGLYNKWGFSSKC